VDSVAATVVANDALHLIAHAPPNTRVAARDMEVYVSARPKTVHAQIVEVDIVAFTGSISCARWTVADALRRQMAFALCICDQPKT